jgi:signal transduction histidine kinase
MAAAGRRRRTGTARAQARLRAWALLLLGAGAIAGAEEIGPAGIAKAARNGPELEIAVSPEISAEHGPPPASLSALAPLIAVAPSPPPAAVGTELRSGARLVEEARNNDDLEAQLEAAEKRASRFRTALGAVAALLLLFGATKAAQVRGYLHQIEAANRELDERVRLRTRELSEANESLRLEIAGRERVESRLRIAHKLESLGQLAAGVAHEINTPIQYVSDNVAFVAAAWRDISPLLELRNGDEHGHPRETESSHPSAESIANLAYLRSEVPAALTQALYGLQQIAGIVAAMRNLSHPGASAFEPADLNKAIESTALVARNEWKHHAELTLDLDDSLPLVPCDVSAVNQAVLNLIVNAAQAIAETRAPGDLGYITIASRRLAEHAEISVEDDGPGVPREIEDRIFDPFFTTKDVGVGTGQGLAIAHGIIAGRHGGSLTHEPGRAGRGARFVIRLPLETAAAAGGETAAQTEATEGL